MTKKPRCAIVYALVFSVANYSQAVLNKLLSKRNLSYLDPDEKQSQFQMSRSFMDGLNQVSELFKNNFQVSARGMSRPYWAEDAKSLAEVREPSHTSSDSSS